MPGLDILSTVAGSVPNNMDMLNLVGGAFTNVQNQKANLKMYERQYADQIAFWNMNNQYNTPANQIQRFKDAGLNPHLIYGQGSAGNSSSPPSVPDLQPANFREPKFEGNTSLMANIMAQADLRIKAAQANNLETQTEVIRQDANLRRVQALRADFDYGFERGLADVSADYRRENLRKLRTDIDISVNRDAREAASNSSSVQEAAERMLTMREQRKSLPLERGRISADTDRIREDIVRMKRDGTLDAFEIALREHNISFRDPMWARYVAKFFDKVEKSGPPPVPGVGTVGGLGPLRLWSWLTGQ